ncbi:hypothetical protein [Hymenobacter lapidiphilus]|uniref:DUF3575 domain-containing protein n=1 Tax=Hymenobacter lapidiphilus TaxID=2608003 RepID=A0A7Y7PN71_9BACT|nr:hypothetical protein [Hymenobacter lapidiphilus]NVO30924.1 hypothetical protein [Hymenobacter lapidiphilus]
MKTTIRFAALFLLLLSSSAALAQVHSTPADSLRPSVRAYRNVVRLDVLVVLVRNLSYLLDGGTALPLLVGYERQLGPHVSGNVEALLDAGNAKERITGLALQMRYYVATPRHPTGLTGLYVAPMVGARLVKRDYLASFVWYTPSGYIQRRVLGGAGGAIGWQTTFGPQSRLLFDTSLGIMGWKQLNNSAVPIGCINCSDDSTHYEQGIIMPDARFSLGYRF